MKYYIYKIINPQKEVYIGRTKEIKVRFSMYKKWKHHKKQPKLFSSFEKYGIENHIFEILEYTDDLSLEYFYIEKYNSYTNGLNSNKGGGGPQYHTEKTKKLISEKGKSNKGGRKYSHWKGKTRSQEMKSKLSKSKKGKPIPQNEKPILAYDKQGNFIAEYPSQEKAAQAVNGNPTAINNALKKGGAATSSSYIWRYKK